MCNHEHKHQVECNHFSHVHETSPVLKIVVAIIILLIAIFVNMSQMVKFTLFFLAYLIAGADVLVSAFKNIMKGKIFDENFLMGIATLGAFGIKEYPEAVMVMILYQIGEYFQHRAVEKSRNSITALMDIRPDYANVEEDGRLIKKSPYNIKIGDIIAVQAGEKIPLDGIVVEGEASINTSALTGESVPRELKTGSPAISGCINTNGLLKIKVTKEFGNSTVSKILELVEHASSQKAKAEKFITKFAKYYTPAVVLGAILLAVLPPLVTGTQFTIWIERALTFLVISCPCALVISIPMGFFAGIGGASRCGILIKGSSYLQTLSKPYAVVFDKTGTLTKGIFKVTQINPQNGFSKNELLQITALAENYSSHPIALSIKEAYGKDAGENEIKNISEIAGNGVKASVNNRKILAGSSRLMDEFGIEYQKAFDTGTIVYTAIDGKFAGYIRISDEIKDDAVSAISLLKKLGIKTVMLSGDSASTANHAGKELNIDEIYSQLLPSDKVEKLEELLGEKPSGKSVIFVGDGINDAPVLTRADVGIAMGAMGSDAAIEAADAVIMDDNPSKIVTAIKISRKTMAIVKENIAFALLVKALFLILGAAGFMTMWGAVFADVGVTLLAVLNSLRAFNITGRE